LVVSSIFFILSVGVVMRLFALQVVEHPSLAARAEERGRIDRALIAERGAVFARRMHDSQSAETTASIAMNRDVARLFADNFKTFEAGATHLTPPEREKLVRLATVLNKRPGLALSVSGTWAMERTLTRTSRISGPMNCLNSLDAK